MARLNVSWSDTRLPDIGAEGYGTQEGTIEQLATQWSGERASVLYVYDPADSDAAVKLRTTMGLENVGAALRAFQTKRINVAKIKREDLREEYAKDAPAFYFYTPEGDLVTRLRGSVSAPEFQRALEKTFGKSYTLSMGAFLKMHRDILNRLDRVSGKKSVLAEKVAMLESSGKLKGRSAKQVAHDEKEIATEEEKIQKDEDALFQRLLPEPATAAVPMGG